MENFVCYIPTKVWFGKGQISNLPAILDRYGGRVLLCYGGGSIKRSGLYDTVCGLLQQHGCMVYECGGIEPNPTLPTVARGVKICRQEHVDVVLAVGGGSVIDCGKAIACGTKYNGDLWQMVMHPETLHASLPLVSILTAAATGSEMDWTSVITNPTLKIKKGFRAECMFPKESICDPTYTFSVSPRQTAAGSADIMSHVMESYFSVTEDADIADGLSEVLLKTVIRWLPEALKTPDSYPARANLMWAATMGINGIAQFGKYKHWSCHAIEHELTAYYDVTHGVGLAILTPRWMEHVLNDQTVGRFDRFARNVWGLNDPDPYVLARKGIAALADFFCQAGLPARLRDLQIDDRDFAAMAADAVRLGKLSEAYVPLNEQDVQEIYQACL